LAGDFTNGALIQLKSLGFTILYFPYDLIIKTFNLVDIDAFYDENTPDAEFVKKVTKWNLLSNEQRQNVSNELTKLHLKEILRFMQTLELAITRMVLSIRIFPLHGNVSEFNSIEKAVDFIENYNENTNNPIRFIKYAIEIIYSNGEKLKGEFLSKETAMQFIRSYQHIL